MSKISLKPALSGTATFTIEAPATNTDRIFELPDEAGKILTNGGAIDVDASAPNDSVAIDSAGNVGIGTTNPLNTLHVNGTLRLNNARFDSIEGNQGLYAARVFVNFNGFGGASIRRSRGVSSVVRNGTGDYTINFTNPFNNASYVPVSMAARDINEAHGANALSIASTDGGTGTVPNTNFLRINNWRQASANGAPTLRDSVSIFVAIFW